MLNITRASGRDKKACMVISFSQAAPHHVQTKSDGQYACDSSCLQWVSSQCCSHTIAASEYNGELALFLQWFVKYAENLNISVLVMSGLLLGRGRKGGKPKCQCAKRPMPPADNYSLRPGLGSEVSINTGELLNTGTMLNLSQPVSVVVITTATSSSVPLVSTSVSLTPAFP